MFAKYRAYYAYRTSILNWIRTIGYDASDVVWVYPWQSPTTFTDYKVVVSFEQVLTIAGFVSVFENEHITILERLPENQQRFRFGLPEQLAAELLAFVRKTAIAHREQMTLPNIHEQVSTKYHEYLTDDFTVDVGVWVDGLLRGSVYRSAKNQLDPFSAAATHTINDPRYKPVSRAELERARFEINIVPNLWVAVTTFEQQRQKPPYTLATRCLYQNEPISMYVPIVANIRRFEHANEYYAALAYKARVRFDNEIHFQQAPTLVAVETLTDPLLLTGVYPKNVDTQVSSQTVDLLAAHLAKNVHEDGFICIKQEASGKINTDLDAARLSFVLSALAEYTAVTKNEQALSEIKKLATFLGDLFDTDTDNPERGSLTKVYAQLAKTYLPQHINLPSLKTEIVFTPKNDLQLMQYVKSRLLCTNMTAVEAAECRQNALDLFSAWKQKQNTVSPVMYADLLILLRWSNLQTEVKEFADFLRKHQATDGSFPGHAVVYTRGVGKLAEAAAANPETHDIAKKALQFMRQMQYAADTLYHIPKQLQPYFMHGFRHDAWNRDLWLDGSAHALLLELRLAHATAYQDHERTLIAPYQSLLTRKSD